MPHKRGSHMSAALGDCLYVMGGWDSEAYLDRLEVYDTRAGRWRSAPPLITPRAYGSTVVLDSQIYVIGGLAGAVSLLSFLCAAASLASRTLSVLHRIPASAPPLRSSGRVHTAPLWFWTADLCHWRPCRHDEPLLELVTVVGLDACMI